MEEPIEQSRHKRQKFESSGAEVAAHDSSASQAFTNQALTMEGRKSEQRETDATFGETQGAAGLAVPEEPSNPSNPVSLEHVNIPSGQNNTEPKSDSYKRPADSSSTPGEGLRPPDPTSDLTGPSDDQTSGFELGVVGIEDKLHNGDFAGADVALIAASKAKNNGDNDNAVFDALEQAENQYENDKKEAEGPQGTKAQRISQRLDIESNGPQSGAKKLSGLQMDNASRQKIRDKMLASLQKSPFVSTLEKEQQHREIDSLELAIFQNCSSRPVYISKAGNLSRLLSKLSTREEMEDLPRIASGLSKQVMQGITADIKPRNDTTGLQGLVPK